MSENSIAQTDAAAEPERWWFTFGSGHRHPVTDEDLSFSYVVIEGTYDESRDVMFASPFGRRWSHQYRSAERAGVDEFGLREVPMLDPLPPAPASLDPLDEWPQPDVSDVDEHEARAAVLVDELPEPAPTVAQEIAIGLRALADMLDANPDLDDDTYLRYMFAPLNVYTKNRAAVARFARAAMGAGVKVGKHQGEKWAGIDIPFGNRVELHVFVEREEICERVVTGTEEVTKEVPDPEALAAVPLVTVTEVVEQVEWICRPLLADDPAQVAAALLTPDSAELPAAVAF